MMKQNQQWDVVVVGAGIAGASLGHALAPSHRILVLERESQPGYHTTGRSAAFFTETYGNRVVRALNRASRSFFDNPPEGFSDIPLWRPRPVLQAGRADQRDKVDTLFQDTHGLSPELTLVDSNEIARQFPPIKPGYAERAVLDPIAMELDVHAIHQGYLRSLKRHGGEVICDANVTQATWEKGIWTIKSSAGTFEAPILVNAAGAWGDTLATLAGAAPSGLTPLRRTIVVYDRTPPSDDRWALYIDIEESFYIKPESGGILASPCDETPSPPCDAQPEELDVARAVARAEEATGVPVSRIRRKWAGLRTFAPDRSPVVGFDPDQKGFFWLAGQGGFGIMTSPALGKAAAALLRGAPLPDDIAALGVTAADLAPGRPALGPAMETPLGESGQGR
ncbi:FAD-binding oxidoreductase [Magnetospira sp. QH-2]|uniref:NAD(P)/FAD-dependent oxidoreductase n=1 Tax=Magnetospira sp. (strain QH-2) TaxID=1288970 RepID=UPI00208ED51D|nr:FAD-binding oxidoreductase [Magnetospira sp. QH-2]